jgi:hypothetical protein
VHTGFGAAVQRKIGLGGHLLLERRLPAALEVDGVHEHQPGELVQRALRKELADLAPGLVLGPGVDAAARRFGLAQEVGLHGVGAVGGAQGLEVGGQELEVFLRPERVGLHELGVLGGALQVLLDGAEPGAQVLGLGREGEHRGDLFGGAARGALVGHGEGRVHAVGREEDIARLLGLGGVEFKGYPVGAGHGVVGGLLSRGAAQTGGQRQQR